MGDCHSYDRISVHQALGGGSVADVLLWRKRCGGVVLLGSSTILWFLFERAGYNCLSFVSNVLLLLVAILFFWGKSASLLNRPLPPLPDLEISDQSVVKVADEIQVWVNHALSIARDIAMGRNLSRFLQVVRYSYFFMLITRENNLRRFFLMRGFDHQVAFLLWVVSYVGSVFNFLTLVYIGVLLSLSVPVLYEKFQDHIDEKLCKIQRVIQMQYRKIDESLLKKIPLPQNKQKKTQ
ncbi:reticulon-like protein B11 [Citrus sinensis]|uniref:Reticulon-like protein B11 n=1 Tax=Citrus sinensis TaxID=2711 RepID=A0ACB8IED3_CITSI|nr:reticulon-like protein B11 [Citrus sinensis]